MTNQPCSKSSPATINHALAVLASFYAFHAPFGRGPVMNPVPEVLGSRLEGERWGSDPPRVGAATVSRQKNIRRAVRNVRMVLADSVN